jgi:hypothetical protein
VNVSNGADKIMRCLQNDPISPDALAATHASIRDELKLSDKEKEKAFARNWTIYKDSRQLQFQSCIVSRKLYSAD